MRSRNNAQVRLRARFRDPMGAKIRGVSRATSIREWGCVASGGRTTLQWVRSLRSSRPSHWYRLARPSRTSRADRPPSARAISPGSRARADRPLSPLIRDRPFHHFAGMGCSPPHIALLSGLQGTGMTGRQITDVLNRLAMQFGPVQGRLLPRCKCVPALLDEFRASRDREENVRRCWFFRASPRDFFFFAPRIRRTRPPRSPLSTLSDLVHLSVPLSLS